MKRSERAFTLIEVLVVVSILGVLMGLVSILVMKAGRHQKEQDAKALVTAYLPNIIERYNSEFSRYPAMSMAELNRLPRWKELAYEASNSTNECIEALVVALRHPDFTARLEESDIPGEKPFGNTDKDDFKSTPAGSTGDRALEIIDPWGNPIVYIHKNHYGKTFQIMNADEVVVDVEALRRPNGTYYNQNKFQIICLGKDGEQDEGALGDDIRNFKIEEPEDDE